MKPGLSSDLGTRIGYVKNFTKRILNHGTSGTGFVICLVLLLMALLAPYIAPYPKEAGAFTNFANALKPPSWQHLFGTDDIGRDILTRVMFGLRLSLAVALAVVLLAVPFGVILGLIAGYISGKVRTIILRFTDVFMAIPPMAMALAVIGALTPSVENELLALSVIWWTWYVRLAYSTTVRIKSEAFVEAARSIGASKFYVMFREILPNCAPELLVKTTIDVGIVVLVAAAISYLGLGARPPTPELGTMVAGGTAYLPYAPWVSIIPGMFIVLIVAGFYLLGDGLRILIFGES